MRSRTSVVALIATVTLAPGCGAVNSVRNKAYHECAKRVQKINDDSTRQKAMDACDQVKK